MSDDFYSQVLGYQSAMAQARQMLTAHIITEADYYIIEAKFAEKYSLSPCSLFREIDLLYSGYRGNMSHYKGVKICKKQ